jgi:ABC-type transporter Mla MlaB component
MALQILECNGTFHLKGALNVTTSNPFITHFKHVLKNTKDVTINIDQVKEIDRSGVTAFKTIYSSAQKDNKQFSITGHGCKEIYDEFRYYQIA